jgi:C2H2 type zinc-finger (2 copies)
VPLLRSGAKSHALKVGRCGVSNPAFAAQDGQAAGKPLCTDASGPLDAADIEQWDVARSLFDNHVSSSFADNLAYMYKEFGFYFPDSEFLSDPEGLLKCVPARPPASPCAALTHTWTCMLCALRHALTSATHRGLGAAAGSSCNGSLL